MRKRESCSKEKIDPTSKRVSLWEK